MCNIHLILLDDRYDYDKETLNRLGDEQYEWLEKSLRDHPNSDLTLIATGIVIQNDNVYNFDERFLWNDKKRLYDILNRTSKSGTVFITGDMHYGLMMESPCKAINCGYKILEVVSSGLTHSTADYIAFMPEWSYFFIQPFYSFDKPYSDRNYGLIKVLPKIIQGEKSVKVSVIVKDQDGQDVFRKELDPLADLQFNTKFSDRNAELCIKQHRSNALWSLFNIARVALFNSLNGWWSLDVTHFVQARRSYFANFSFLTFCGTCLYIIFKALIVAVRLALFLTFNSLDYFKMAMNFIGLVTFCCRPGCANLSKFQCQTCQKLRLPPTYFCSIDC